MALPVPVSLRRVSAPAATLALLLVATACAADAEPSAATSGTDGADAAVEAGASGDAGSAGDGDYLDELYAASLHEGVAPADPGTAYLEAGGERFEFTEIECSLDETPGASRLEVTASGEISGTPHKLYLKREIGPDIGFNLENEHVQLAYFVPGEGGAADKYSNALSQHSRDEGEEPEWLQGAGESPLLRVVGDQVTATGELGAVPFNPDAGLDDAGFVAAATCP